MKALRLYSSVVLLVLSCAIGWWRVSASKGRLAESPRPSETRARPRTISLSANGLALNLGDGIPLKTNYGSDAAAAVFQPQQNGAAALVSADFDEDGVPDLVSGYAMGSGAIVFQRGNIDGIYPNAPEARARRARGQFNEAAFSPEARTFAIPESAAFIAAGDFNADGHQDVVACAYGSASIYLMSGDGHGAFTRPAHISLNGRVSAIATGEIGRPDGQADIAVSVVTDAGPKLLVYEHPEGAFRRKPESFDLPEPATAIALGMLDEDFLSDIAVACGTDLVFIHGHQQIYPWDMIQEAGISRPRAEVGRRSLPFRIAAVTSGRFSSSRDSLALMAEDGNLHLLEPPPTKRKKQFDLALPAQSKKSVNSPAGAGFQDYRGLRNVTPSAEEAARRGIRLVDRTRRLGTIQPEDLFVGPRNRSRSPKEKPLRQVPKLGPDFYTAPSRISDWIETAWPANHDFAAAAQSGKKNLLVRTRVSGSQFDDLLVMDEHARQILILNRGSQGTSSSQKPAIGDWQSPGMATIEVDGGATTVLPMRLNADALSDLVIARNGTVEVVLTAVATTYTVNSADDSSGICQPGGACTLRGAIQTANSNPGADSIVFDIPGGGVHEIDPVTELPIITGPVTIDGTTQPGYAGTPLIEINGDSSVASGADGLKVRASDCVIRGLAVNSFPHFEDLNTGSFIGGNGLSLETLANQTRHTNIIVEGNFLGTDASGTFDLGNASTGLIMFDVDNSFIGGTTPEARNVISGNGSETETGAGISVVNGNFNQFKGNYIGINAAGDEKLQNSYGFDLTGSLNTVGGDEPGAGNTISGNGDPDGNLDFTPCGEAGLPGDGLVISYLTPANSDTNLTQFNSVKGNRIGTDPDGVNPLGNCFFGIDADPITATIIGSIAEQGRNIISDNGHYAINCTYILAPVALPGGFCIISGNNIGTDITGTVGVRNDGRNTPFPVFPGFAVVEGSAVPDTFVSVGAPGGTTPGGPCTGFCNLISGNDEGNSLQSDAVSVFGEGLTGVFNSYIGTNKSGTSALPNQSGVSLNGNSYLGNVGTVTGAPNDFTPLGNLISGNVCGAASINAQGNFGDEILFASAKNNFIGTDVTGNSAIPNNPDPGQCNGGALVASANPNSVVVIGGTDKPGERNVISGNGWFAALDLRGNAVVKSNYIGVAQDGTTPLGNIGNGIHVRAAGVQVANVIGGTGANEANVIRNNTGAGIFTEQLFPQFGVVYSISDIKANSIFNNGGLGIDLFPLGVTANDGGDTDVGPNGLQNYPLLDLPTFNGDGTVTVTGRLNSKSGQNYRLDFYANNPADPTNYGEGQNYVGSKNVTTNAGGNVTFSFTSSGPVPANSAIVANATGFEGTSEFSCVAGQCLADVSVVKDDDVDPIEAGQTLTYTLAVANAGPAAAPNVVVTDTLPSPNITFISATPSQGTCMRSGSIVTCALGTINSSANASIEIKVTPTQVGTRTNNVSVTHNLVDPDPSNNSDQETTEVVNSLIVVTTTGDQVDANPNDNVCDVDENQPQNQCTLRAAIQVSNARAGKDAITFDISGGGIKTISPQSALPAVSDSATIDATTQPGYSGIPVVELNGSAAGGGIPGFLVNGGNTTVKGFAINRFDGKGIWIQNSNNNAVEACFIGTDPTGNTAQANHADGIFIDNASGNRIGGATADKRNVISGNGVVGGSAAGGLNISGTATNNIVQGNYIGTNAAGTAALANVDFGVFISASNNTIGGSAVLPGIAPGNVIAGNDTTQGFAIGITGTPGSPAVNNNIRGNLIGTDAGGTVALGYKIGVFIVGDSDSNFIGGPSPDLRNIISGNQSGVAILSPDSAANQVQGNYIGTDITGNAALPNTAAGVDIQGSPNNIIGGSTAGAGNVIACNGSANPTSANIAISFLQATGNTIQGNYVGIFANGTTAQTPKATYGVIIVGGAQNTIIGGTTAAMRNVISGNKYGVFVAGAINQQLGNNTIQGNYIGTDSSGSQPLGNEVGIGLFTTFNNLVGGPSTNGRNIISANAPAAGVLIGSGGGNNQIKSNYIGTDVSGTKDLGNAAGVAIYQSSDNVVGSTSSPNLISGNDPLGGVLVLDVAAPPTPTLSEAMSYPAASGSKNGQPVAVMQSHIPIGPQQINQSVAGDRRQSQPAAPTASVGNLIAGNVIGLTGNSAQALPNKPAGVILTEGASNNSVLQNTISGNQDTGIFIGNTQANHPRPESNTVRGNIIGLGRQSTPIPNTKHGIVLLDAMNNVIGGSSLMDLPNVIAANGEDGLVIQGNSTGNVFKMNFVGVTPEGQKLGNGKNGVKVENATGNTIEGNVIGDNRENGVKVTTTTQPPGPGTVQGLPPTSIVGNLIGAAVNQSSGQLVKAANTLAGILVENTSGVQIGSATPNGGNSIVANGAAGIAIQGIGASLNTAVNNTIGAVDSAWGSISGFVGNGGGGIQVMNAADNQIGGNQVTQNTGVGVTIEGGQSSNNSVQGNAINSNGSHGVEITDGASLNNVGGQASGAGNTINNNGGAGINLSPTAGQGNNLDPNSIFGNNGPGIDIGGNGTTPNDPGDADTGPNNLQNFPEMTRANIDNTGVLSIVYKINSQPGNSNYGTSGLYVEFFKADSNLQGQTFIVSSHYTVADYNDPSLAGGPPGVKQIFVGNAPSLGIQVGDQIVATATDSDGNTSEFTSTGVGMVTGSPTAAPATISGRVTKPDGSPLGGTVLRLNGGASRITVSDSEGNYRFENVATDNFYSVTPSLANYSFAPASRSFSLNGNMTDAGFTGHPDAAQSANAIDTTEYFVRQQYLDFLGREPDQGGLEYWISQFDVCNGDVICVRNKRIDVSAAFFASLEFQQTGSYIYGLYAGTLGRRPGYDEFMMDRAQVVGGSGLEPAKAAFADAFVQRSGFTARYPQSMTREQFVDAILQTMTRRSGVDLESLRAGLLNDYLSGGRSLVVRHAAEASAFVAAEYNKAFVLMEYFGYLRRDIDDGGYAFWLDVLNNGTPNNYRGMVCAFLTSTEYQIRFNTVITHSNAECGS